MCIHICIRTNLPSLYIYIYIYTVYVFFWPTYLQQSSGQAQGRILSVPFRSPRHAFSGQTVPEFLVAVCTGDCNSQLSARVPRTAALGSGLSCLRPLAKEQTDHFRALLKKALSLFPFKQVEGQGCFRWEPRASGILPLTALWIPYGHSKNRGSFL